MIKTYKPKENGGAPDRLYLIEDDQLLAILYYGAYSDPDRVSKTKRFNEKEVLEESLSYSARDEPDKVTGRDTYKYKFDSHGNWTTRNRHTKFRDNPDKIMGQVTRTLKYRGG